MRRCLGWPEYFQPRSTESIHNTRRQRGFRANHGHVDVLALRKFDQLWNGGNGDILHAVFQGCACIAGGNIYFLHLGALRQTPRQRVLATAGTDD